ncbi:putative membrane protein [Methylorubrum populi]|uniref:Putative membrane protein n=1 Tax=Methylorubrum populi TaxID=223967 RepID=A0A833N006_9HYPH|nr:putative membrane protein [Methylorubrum populi]
MRRVVSVGLLALLDDVVALTKVAAASLDDVAAQAGKAGSKAAGVVIDDAAVTPRYVVGFSPDRELPIVWRIARGSLINKLVFLLPAALLLSAFAPWAITPLLLLGGLYLAYEGAEKVYEMIVPHEAPAQETGAQAAPDAQVLEERRVSSAIKTDFILSAEIMAITLSSLDAGTVWSRAVVMALVAIGITVAVYGAVALIVKADDIGVALARRGSGVLAAIGRGLVRGMPGFLKALALLGTAAMVWVGGGIIVHSLAAYGFAGPEHGIHAAAVAAAGAVPALGGAVEWLVTAAGAGVIGLVVGFALIPLASKVLAPAWTAMTRLLPMRRKEA